jgi:hypothetical protein
MIHDRQGFKVALIEHDGGSVVSQADLVEEAKPDALNGVQLASWERRLELDVPIFQTAQGQSDHHRVPCTQVTECSEPAATDRRC